MFFIIYASCDFESDMLKSRSIKSSSMPVNILSDNVNIYIYNNEIKDGKI